MLVFRYNVLSVLLFVVILNCGTASEFGGIRGLEVMRLDAGVDRCGGVWLPFLTFAKS